VPVLWQGIFATHLHQLLDVDLRAPRLKRFMMETRRTGDGELEPTCRMVPGQSTESLALVVAAKSGLPANVVNRAAQLYQVRPARRQA
jgi:DNA mismatch repair ATPase MutS